MEKHKMDTVVISNRRRLIEIGAVLLTAAGKFVFMDGLGWKLAFIIVVMGGWVAYVIARTRRVPTILHYWGFSADTFKEVLRMVLPFGLLSIGTCFAIGFYRDTINLTWHIIPILILYPIWGTIQQFLVIALIAGNLKDLEGESLVNTFIIFATALLFGLLHYPYFWLVVGTFVLALFYGYVYLRARNLYVMGIFHGWLGGVFFYTVVGRDPFAEMFGTLF